MKRTFIYLILSFHFVAFSQTTFTNTYNIDPVNNPKYSFDESHSIFEHNNLLYTLGTFEENKENSGGVVDGIPDTTHSMLMKFNSAGDVQNTNFYTANSCYNNVFSYFVSNNYLIGTGLVYSPKNFCGFYDPDQPPPNIDPDSKRRILVTSTDLETNQRRQSVYRTGEDSYSFGIVASNDNNFLVGNVIQKSRVVCLLKVNQQGDSLENKVVYDSIPGDYEPIFLDKIETGYLIFSKSFASNATHIDVLNNNGDTIGNKNLGLAPDRISKTSDGGYILLTAIGTKPKLTKLSKELTIEWDKTYDVYATNFVRETSDKNFILGTKDFVKVNKDSVLWKRRYFGESNITPWYFINGATETSDNGFAMTGFFDANTFVVKTDCEGNLIWSEKCNKKVDEPLNMAVFPNPFKDELNFQVEIEGEFNVVITNSLGQVVRIEEQTKINTSELSAGIYFYSITIDKKFYHSGKLVKY